MPKFNSVPLWGGWKYLSQNFFIISDANQKHCLHHNEYFTFRKSLCQFLFSFGFYFYDPMSLPFVRWFSGRVNMNAVGIEIRDRSSWEPPRCFTLHPWGHTFIPWSGILRFASSPLRLNLFSGSPFILHENRLLASLPASLEEVRADALL